MTSVRKKIADKTVRCCWGKCLDSQHKIMMISRIITIVRRVNVDPSKIFVRNATTTRSGGILPPPFKTPFGLIGIICTVVPGLLIGAAISKNIANFLEENDLFVPSDDDDDDD